MVNKFWEAVGGKLADRWATASAKATVFWLGVLGSLILSSGNTAAITAVGAWIQKQPTMLQVMVAVAALAFIGTSALIVQSAADPTLRILEGYWPAVASPLRKYLVEWHIKRAEHDENDWNTVYQRIADHSPTAEDLLRLSQIDGRRQRRPRNWNQFMPTRIGNILRSAELRPRDKYGLDGVAIWPRLWLLLPDVTRQELSDSRAKLDAPVATLIWSLLFCVTGIWEPWCVTVGIAVASYATQWSIPNAARVFGDLVEATYDVHRTTLYEALRWPLPQDPVEERKLGEKLTSYLMRGADEAWPTLQQPR